MALSKVLITPTTAASEAIFSVDNGYTVPITVSGLTGAEEIAVEIYTAADTWVAYMYNGTAIVLSANTNKIGFDVPGRYRLNKPITAAAVGVLRDVA